MKYLLAVAAFLIMPVFLTPAAEPQVSGVPTAVHYVDHNKIAPLFEKIASSKIVSDPGLAVSINRRGVGQVEYHEHTNHIIYVVDGETTLVTGGTMVDPKRTSPEQMTAASIEGGETYHLTKGDVITIPAKTPHWYKEVPTKTVSFYEVNIESQ